MTAPADIVLASDEVPLADDYWGDFVSYVTGPVKRLGGHWPTPHAQHLSIVKLGTHLRSRGFTPVVVDNVLRLPRCRETLRRALEGGTPVFGLSTAMLMERSAVELLVNEARALNPGVLIVLGGASAERRPDVRELGDVTVVGEGEETLAELLSALKSGRDLGHVSNIWRRDAGGRLRFTGARSHPVFENSPSADWSLLDVRPSLFYAVEASRGCRHRCAFCSYPRLGTQSLRRLENVVDEVVRDRDRFGAGVLWFSDSNLTSFPDRVEALCALLAANGPSPPWSGYARADDFARAPAMAEKMKSAGAVGFFVGVESGDDGVLRAMRKGYDAKTALEGIRRAQDAGLLVHANFIIGFPGETPRSVDRTLEFIREAKPATTAFTVFWVPPHSDASVWSEKKRWKIRGDSLRWEHETMDCETARAELRRAMKTVIDELPDTLIADEYLIVELLGYGLGLGEAVGYCRSLRDFHRAERVGDAATKASASARILSAHARINDHLRASCAAT